MNFRVGLQKNLIKPSQLGQYLEIDDVVFGKVPMCLGLAEGNLPE